MAWGPSVLFLLYALGGWGPDEGRCTYPYVHTFLGSLDWRAGGGEGEGREAEKDFLCGPAQNKLSCSPLSCFPS